MTETQDIEPYNGYRIAYVPGRFLTAYIYRGGTIVRRIVDVERLYLERRAKRWINDHPIPTEDTP